MMRMHGSMSVTMEEQLDAEEAELVAELEAVLALFEPQKVDRLVQLEDAGKWMTLAKYLKDCVEYHANDSVLVPVPECAYADDGTLLPDGLVKVHAELFLSPHRQHVLELIAAGKDGSGRVAARRHFEEHVKPLWDAVPQDRRWLQSRFTELEQIISDGHQQPSALCVSSLNSIVLL